MISSKDKNAVRKARHARSRRHLIGTSERPRLNVYRSLNHIYAQLINDEIGSTLAAASTLDAELKPQLEAKSKAEAAKLVGELIGRRAVQKGVALACIALAKHLSGLGDTDHALRNQAGDLFFNGHATDESDAVDLSNQIA